MITVRDAAGREISLRHYELLAWSDFRDRGDWIAESDPRVLDWLEPEVKKRLEQSECGVTDRDNESRMAKDREILRRNCRTLEA